MSSQAPRALLFAALLAASALAGCAAGVVQPTDAGGAQADGPFSRTDVFPGDYGANEWSLSRGPYSVGAQEVALVPSPLDGEAIMIYVMRPDVPEGTKVPVIMDAGPYFPPLQGADLGDNALLTSFVSHGYAFALVAVRGTGDSGGCMDLMGPAERHDVDAAVTWLGTQPWSNGRVGMFGGSYDGSTQWEAASTGNPHLKTIAPIAGIPDLFSFMVRNGSYMSWTPVQFAAIYWGLYGPALYNPATGRDAERTAGMVVCPESFEGMAASVASAATGERDPLGFWAERDWRDEVEANYRGTIYLIHGFGDVTVEPHNAYPFVKRLEEKGVVVKHTLGPWGHEIPWRGDSLEILLRWYDRWLKEDPSVDIGPRAQVLDNVGGWRSEDAWPPEDGAEATLHLTADGRLAPEPGPAGEPVPVGPLAPVQDPVEYAQRFNAPWKLYEDPAMEACPACPSFATEPSGEDLRFAGAPRLRLALTPLGPGGHVAAVLRAVHPDGSSQRLSYGVMDLRFAAGDGPARPVVPGQPVVANLELQPTDAVVPAGSRLVLTLHQGGAGLRWPPGPSLPVLLDAGGEASALSLWTFERGPEDLHEAPPAPGTPKDPT